MPENNTTEKKHAILSPSSSAIWLNCTPSALMAELMPEQTSEYTVEGTNAHTLAEYKIHTLALGEAEYPDPRTDEKFASTVNYEMEHCTDEYGLFVGRMAARAEEEGYFAEVNTEIKLDLSFCIPEGSGTADCVMIAGDTLSIVDFKYGAFRKVEGERNTQMMIYALGALNHFSDYGPFAKVTMSIFQPRMDNIVTDTITVEELNEWKNAVLIPQAAAAIRGEGELVKGDHCEFCRAKLLCRKFREETYQNLEILKTMYTTIENSLTREQARLKKDDRLTAMANMLSVEDMAKIIVLGEGLDGWIKQVREHAKTTALAGTKIPGFKLIEKAGTKTMNDDAAAIVKAFGLDPAKPKEYKSKSALQKEMGEYENGAAVFNSQVLPLMDDTPATPQLVKEDAKGEEKSAEYFAQKQKEAEEAAKAEEEAQATASAIAAIFQ